MRKRIKELENYINANIPAVTVPITGAASSSWSSYLTFDDHVDARKRLWSLRCSNCSNPICKFEVNKYYDRSIPTITYNGTIEDLINKVNDKDYSTCTNCSISFQNIIINTRNINKFNQFIQTNNCVYTFEYNDIIKFVTYDLYCNVCGIHLKSIDNRTDAQKASLATILKDLHSRYPDAEILGHRDIWGTDPKNWKKMCPCFNVKEWWNTVLEEQNKPQTPTDTAPQ